MSAPLLSEKPWSMTRRTASGTTSVAAEATDQRDERRRDPALVGEGEGNERLEGAERGLRTVRGGCGGHEAW